MLSRFVRNPRRRSRGALRPALVLAVAILVTVGSLGEATARENRHIVDGFGMARDDNTEDPRQGGGGSSEGDPWGGEQRDAGDHDGGGPVIGATPVQASAPTSWLSRLAGLWAALVTFWSSLAR